MRTRYVELNRTFLDFGGQGDESDPDTLRMIAEMTGKRTDWDALLQSPYVVVLGEAGSGKTWEFQERARSLVASGKQAFFCRIEDLAEEGLEQALPKQDDVSRFQSWLNSDDDAVFLLDSVDEARLKGYRFDKPLRKLDRALGGVLKRARLVISCRVSDWRGEADRDTIDAILPCAENSEINDTQEGSHPLAEKKPTGRVRVVQIAPLNRNQIATLSTALGVTNTDAFLRAIGEADAWHFAERPKDVEWLAEYWKVNGRFGTLTDLIKHNVSQKLKETNLDRPKAHSLPLGEARIGAIILAAASTLCRKSALLLPDETIDPDRAASALDPHDVLPDWPSENVDALLTRAIFDEATYGRVRFHHRSVTEYLTALWLKAGLDKGCPRPNIESLLFQERYGCSVAVPSLAPVTAWLSGWDDSIRKKSIEVSPEILIQHGDPQNIPIKERDNLLVLYVQRYADRQRTDHHFDWATLKRFAHADLATTINELLNRYRKNADITILLLRLVESARVSACMETVLAIAVDEEEKQDVRLYAIYALGAAGAEHDLLHLAAYARKKATEVPNRLLGPLYETLFPQILSVDDLLSLIRCTGPGKQRGGLRALTHSFERIVDEACPQNLLLELLGRLIELVQQPPFLKHNGTEHISANFAWLIAPISNLVARILKGLSSEYAVSGNVLAALDVLQRCQTAGVAEWHSVLDDVSLAISEHSTLRRALFWKRANDLRSRGKEQMTYVWQVMWDNLWKLTVDDFHWLVEDVSGRSEFEDRLLALDGALNCWAQAGQSQAQRNRLVSAIGEEPALKERMNIALNPPPQEETEYERKWRKEREAKKREKEKEFRKSRILIEERIENIRTGESLDSLIYLWEFMREEKSRYRWSHTNWRALIPNFGEQVAQAAREGFKRHWVTWKPPLAQKKTDRNGIENGVVVGLTGLALAALDGFDFATLSAEEADIAARYATREFGGFPNWLAKLTEANPKVVREVFTLALTADFSVAADAPHPHAVLSHFPYAPPVIRNLCAPDLFELLQKRDPNQIQTLQEVLRILLVANNVDAHGLALLALQRIAANKDDQPRLLTWLPALFYIEGERAVEFVENHLKELSSQSGVAFMLNLCSTLHRYSERHLYQTKADYFRVPSLRRLIPLVHKHVRPDDDIFHEDAFTPNARDHAERFRNQLVQRLANIPGEKAYRALLDLAEDPGTVRSREWFLVLAQEKPAADAEYEAWVPEDVLAFAKNFETDPKSADDLFRIAMNRLEQLKADIETGDYSERDLFTPKTKERTVQKWVASRLRLLADTHYTVHCEEEVDGAKKPDIRLHHSAVSGPVGIEIKCANKRSCSYNALRTALSEQLVGKYLRDIRSCHGILLLANLGGKGYWDPRDKSGRLEFTALVSRLDVESVGIIKENEDVAALRVIGIDFAP